MNEEEELPVSDILGMSDRVRRSLLLETEMRKYALLLSICLCIHGGCDSHMADCLAGRIHTAESSTSRITFTDRQTAVFEWMMDEDGLQRNARLEVGYRLSDETTIIPNLSSSQIVYFPYANLRLSSSRDSIIACRSDGHNEVFSKK